MTEEYTTKSGLVLHVCAVSKLAMQNLLLSSGLLDKLGEINDLDKINVQAIEERLSATEKVEVGQSSHRLFNYVCGYGITDDPPPDALEELAIIGFDTANARAARIHWLKTLVLDQGDLNGLVAKIMLLTMQDESD